ncbi:MAG: tetratricopeptide repeat protein [Alphaproteobacteria bacterium]
MERRLAAILCADAVGFSRSMGLDEAGTLAALESDIRDILAPAIAAHQGRIVKTTGDGVLAEFTSAVSAVAGALDARRALGERPVRPDRPCLDYRIGIHVGEILLAADDLHGHDVNVAVRIQETAEPGGIYVSEPVFRTVRGKLDADWTDLGEHSLKNIAESVRLFSVTVTTASTAIAGDGPRPPQPPTRSARPSRWPLGGRPAPVTGVPSIAVLPFDRLAIEGELAHLWSGIASDITTDLGKFRKLFVVASHSAAASKALAVPSETIGAMLGVRYLIQGNVRAIGRRARINVQLVEASTGNELWAERYDRSVEELFDVQDDIVRTVVASLDSTLDISERARIRRVPTENLAAYDYYVRGRDLWFGFTAEANRAARDMFEAALRLDPGFARAHGYVSFTLVQDFRQGWNGATAATLDVAGDVATRAVRLGPHDYDNHWSLAVARLYRREFDEAMTAYDRALNLNPGAADLLAENAEALVLTGRPDQAVVQLERAIRLNPLYPDWYLYDLGWAYCEAGRHEQALGVLSSVVTPPVVVLEDLAATQVRLGLMAEARATAERILAVDASYSVERARNWPFKDPARPEAFIADLLRAGLPS